MVSSSAPLMAIVSCWAGLQALSVKTKIGTKNKSDFFNLGSKCGNTTKEVFDTCEQILGKKIKYDIAQRRLGDCAILVADNQKAKEILGWTPEKTLEQSIEEEFEGILPPKKESEKPSLGNTVLPQNMGSL